MKRSSLAALVALAAAGCGGGSSSPTPVPSPQPSPGRAFDGITGAPVAGAAVQLSGSSVRVQAAGYLLREAPNAPELYLWPAPDQGYVRALVYFDSDVGRMNRWAAGLALSSCAEGAADPAAVRDAVEQLAAVSGVQLGAGPCNVRWVVDGADAAWTQFPTARAITYLDRTGDAITGARVVFRTSSAVGQSAAHEGGHVLGLGHSPRREDLMAPASIRLPSVGVYAAGERDQLTMMYRHRRPGNQWPDKETAAAAASPRQRTGVYVD